MNKKVEKVIKELRREKQTWTVTILGDEENKANAFYILMNAQQLISVEKDVFPGINQRTLQALLDAGIKFKTDVKWM